MPLTPDMRRSIDQIRDYLFGGGYPDPVSNAEQLSFLFFFYLVEGIDAENKVRARVIKQPYTSLFDGDWELKNPLNAEGNYTTIPRSHFKWSVWAKGLSGEALVRFVRDGDAGFIPDSAEVAAVQAYKRSQGQGVYPDANLSLRITYGNVMGYSPKDGVAYTPFTTLDGLVAKATGVEPFDAPQAQTFLAKVRDLMHTDPPTVPHDTPMGEALLPAVQIEGELVLNSNLVGSPERRSLSGSGAAPASRSGSHPRASIRPEAMNPISDPNAQAPVSPVVAPTDRPRISPP